MPSDKRARQRARREARMAELRRAQQRRRNIRLGAIVGGVVVLALILALATGGVFSGSSKKTTKVTTAQPTPGTLTATALAALKAIAPPATSSTCGGPIPTPSAPTTTVPAKGAANAIIPAPSATMPFPNLTGTNPHYTTFSAAPPFCIDVTKSYTAVVKTDVGTMDIQLLPTNAPVTVNNFVFLAGYHYFDNTDFFRAVPGFVDQGGNPLNNNSAAPGSPPGYSFADELPNTSAAYDEGAVAMANSGPNTNGSQFFLIMAGGGAQLQPSYSMFGQITSGINVMNKINADGGTTANSGTPVKVTHRIISVTIKESSTPPPGASTTTSTTAPANGPEQSTTTTAPSGTTAPTS